MAYLGRSLSNGNYLKLDDISSQFNGTDTTFNLTAGGQAFYPGSSYSILVILSGVVQEADTAYQVLNNQIIFAAPPDSVDTFYALVLGVALGVGVPANGTVTGDKFARPFSYDNGLLYLDDTNDKVGINTTSPNVALDVVGDASVSGVITATSFSGTATSATTAGYATTAGIATVAQGLTGTPNITVGVITTSSLEVSGNVSIAGTLTYEDVTNIDSLGIVTARTGIQVLAGGVNAVGVVTATSFDGSLALSDVTGLGANVSTFLATPSSSNLASAVTDETGSGALVFATSPTLVTPSLGAASATSINASGIVTATGGFNLGISSAGTTITSGPIATLNFVGTGNTFAINGTTVDISISGGGNAGAGGTWSSNAVGVHTTKIVGVGTDAIAGAANSEGALQVYGNVALVDGAVLTDQNINQNVFIPSGKNGLLIGPVTVGVGLTVDIASGSVLVVV